MSSAERTAPPGVGAASHTRTSQPRSASRLAATRPFGPAPITTASGTAREYGPFDGYRGFVARKRDLAEYETKRDFDATPEPRGERKTRARARKADAPLRFVVQEHHARALHWDLRLERDGVL